MLLTAACLISAPSMAADKDLSCSQLAAEIEELDGVIASADNAALSDKVVKAGGKTAAKTAYYAGKSSSLPWIGGVTEIANAVSSHNVQSAQKNASEAKSRKIKLEAIAEVKECK